MQTIIEQEVEQHDGLYPHNGGRLSEAEFCRRASISQITLLGKAHKTSTKIDLATWLEAMSSKIPHGKREIRKAVTQRAQSWKERHDQIADQYHLSELEMIEIRSRVAELERQSQRDAETIASLQAQLSGGRVVNLRQPKSK
jgi:hypothetical protein